MSQQCPQDPDILNFVIGVYLLSNSQLHFLQGINQLVLKNTEGVPGGSDGKESTCSVGDLGLVPREGKGYPLQYSGLENSTDCITHGVARSRTQLNDFHFSL